MDRTNLVTRMRGDSKNVLGDIGSLNDLLDVLQQNGVSFSHGLDDSLDTKKVEFLKQLLPVDLADHPSMTKEDRADALKQFPKFNKLLPHALKKDLTHLSSRLSRLQKEQIEMLYKSQLRSRDLLRVCVGNLYTLLDPEVPVNRQSRHFNSWAEITALIIDDFVWAIKQQQKLILARHGFSDDSLAAGTSIIPLSMKTKLKEVADFRRSLGLPTQVTGTMASRFFSFRGNSNRRGGSAEARPPPGKGDMRILLILVVLPGESRVLFQNGQIFIVHVLMLGCIVWLLLLVLRLAAVGAAVRRDDHLSSGGSGSTPNPDASAPISSSSVCYGRREAPGFRYSGGRGSKERGVLSRICWGSAACGQGPRTCVGAGREACGGTGERCVGDQGFYIPHDIGEKEKWQTTSVFGFAEAQRGDSYKKFQMEGIKHLRTMLRKGDYLTSVDLKDGYLHVPVAKESQRWLQFRCRGHYRFRCLPFGLASAPRIFSKIVRPVVGHCRARGIRLMAYLDDLIIVGATAEECRANKEYVVELLDVGLGHQCGEVSFSPLHDHRLSRLYGGHRVDAVVGYQRETEKLPWILHWQGLYNREREQCGSARWRQYWASYSLYLRRSLTQRCICKG